MDYQKQIKILIDNLSSWYNDDTICSKGMMTQDLYPYTDLFSPIQINSLSIKNRIVMGPMGNVNMAHETGKPENKMLQYFFERAKGGVGLITTGLVPVDFVTDPSVEDVDDLGIFPRIDRHRSKFAPWKSLAEGCHAFGAKIFIQLTPGLGRVGSPECLIKRHRLPVSSSWNKNFYMPLVPHRPLTDRECRKLIKNSAQASIDAREMGIDGVYFHGHEGYLLEQMTNPAFNRRKLGRYRKWQQFGVDLIREVRKRCGDSYPIMYRIDLTLALKETYGDRMNTVKTLKPFQKERTVEMTLDYMKNLVKAGVDAFDVDLGCYDNWWLPHPPNGMPPGAYLEVSRIVKEYFNENDILSNAGLPVPIVAVGKLGYPDLAEEALRLKQCDMIMLARPLLADPHWPKKVYAGKVSSIIPCIGDQEGCLNQVPTGGHVKCAVNPITGFEDITSYDLKPAGTLKKIAVVGAGPAGVYCAVIAAARGHRVTIFEKGNKAGGKLIPGSIPKMKFELANYVEYLNNLLSKGSEKYSLKVKFNTTISSDDFKKEEYDVIVTATGTKATHLKIDGVDKSHVFPASDFLLSNQVLEEEQSIVIVGGSEVGCEIAHMLHYEKGMKNISIVEARENFMKESNTANRGFLIHYLERGGVKLLNGTTLKTIKNNSIIVQRNLSSTMPDPYITWTPLIPDNIHVPFTKKIKKKIHEIEMPGDIVILATGEKSYSQLYENCLKKHLALEVYNAGDSQEPGRVMQAARSGYEIGKMI